MLTAALLMTSSYSAVGVFLEDDLIAEAALVSVGMFSLMAPVRLWQIESFTQGLSAFNAVVTNTADNFESFDNDLDRVRVGTVLIVLSGIAAIWACSAFLQSSYKEQDTSRRDDTVNGLSSTKNRVMAAISGICTLTGCGLLWHATNEALEAVGAENSSRINAANFYIFLVLIMWLGFAAQLTDLVEVKQLPLVSFGIATASTAGFVNIGTHDRQLWFLDTSIAGVNELHQWSVMSHSVVR